MSRKSQKNQNPVEAATTAPQGANGSRRNFTIAAAAVAVVGVGAVVYGRRGAGDAEDAALAQRPGLASAHAPTLGEATAKVQIVEFLDPACETCAVFYPLIKQVMAANPGQIRLALRHVPLHKGADYVVALLEASRKQGRYWQTLEALLKGQERWVVRHVVQQARVPDVINDLGLNWDQLALDMNTPEVQQRMAQDRADATLLGVKQTPEYFVNGRQMESFGRQQLLDLVDRAVRKAYR
jgi:protein-disulfide isomerase